MSPKSALRILIGYYITCRTKMTMIGKNIKPVAVAVPLIEKDHLTDDEKISIKHLENYIGRYHFNLM